MDFPAGLLIFVIGFAAQQGLTLGSTLASQPANASLWNRSSSSAAPLPDDNPVLDLTRQQYMHSRALQLGKDSTHEELLLPEPLTRSLLQTSADVWRVSGGWWVGGAYDLTRSYHID